MKTIIRTLITCLMFFIGVQLSACAKKEGYDDSDKVGNGEVTRSGLVIYTDHLTGCQYLSTAFKRELTPRMDENHNQICKPELKNGSN